MSRMKTDMQFWFLTLDVIIAWIHLFDRSQFWSCEKNIDRRWISWSEKKDIELKPRLDNEFWKRQQRTYSFRLQVIVSLK